MHWTNHTTFDKLDVHDMTSVVAKKLGCQVKIKLRWPKEGVKDLVFAVGGSASCALPSVRWPKIQPAIATFDAFFLILPAAGA